MTRRANSVWTAEGLAQGDPEARIDEVERFYAERGLASTFQLCPASVPTDLDERLAARGYAVDAPVAIMIAGAPGVLERASRGSASVEPEPSESWLELSARQGRFRGVEVVYRGLLSRISGAGYALACEHGEPVAVGLGVTGGEWLGVFSMSTRAAHRRRGFAQAILAALADHALERGASSLYLQVERDNAAALALYEKIGFRELYGYHYRVKHVQPLRGA